MSPGKASRKSSVEGTATHHTISLPGSNNFSFSWDAATQHTLSWPEPLRVALDPESPIMTVVGAGSVNLYTMPTVNSTVGGIPYELTPGQLQAVYQLILTIATHSSTRHLFDAPDSSGATPVLAIAVANTPGALELTLSLYAARPDLITQCHKPGHFVGENALHIFATNRQEDVLCEVVRLAHEHLNRRDLHLAFNSQAVGAFFSDEPMVRYGGTPIAYVCTFALRRALALMLSFSKQSRKMRGVIDLNAPRHACRATGFLPLHAAVANGQMAMHDFMVDLPNLPILNGLNALPDRLTRRGSYAQFTPLQLACHLGDEAMFKHLLDRRSSIVWKWGPLTMFKLDLHTIDSVGGGANDVMEVVARIDAGHRTQEMLLDSCFEGFLHKVYVQKWKRFGRAYHTWLRVLEALYVLSLLTLTLWLKEAPESFLENGRWVGAVVLACSAPMIEEDLRAIVLYWFKLRTVLDDGDAKGDKLFAEPPVTSQPASPDPSPVPLRGKAESGNGKAEVTAEWPVTQLDGDADRPAAHALSQKKWGKVRTSVNVSNLLAPDEAAEAAAEAAEADAAAIKPRSTFQADLRNLRKWADSQNMPGKFLGCALGCGASAALLGGYRPYGIPSPDDPTDLGTGRLPIWTVLALALLFAFSTLSTGLFLPMQNIGIFLRTTQKIVIKDVSVFGILSAILFCTYGLTAYVAYPRIGTHQLPYFPGYNDAANAVHELFELALLGEPSTYQLNGGFPVDQRQFVDLVTLGVRGAAGDGGPAAILEYPPLAPHEWIEMGVFTIFYITYALISCILLLNLLIAMMNHTFISAQEEAVLEWRVLYARNLLKLEMLAEPFECLGWFNTHGGELLPDGKWYCMNRVHNQEAYHTAGSDVLTEEHVGMFGAKSENDTDAVNSYALAMGLEPRELADKAARVQAIYKGHRRRMGNWKVQNVKEQAAKTHDFLGNAFAGGSVTVPSTSLQRAKTAMPTAGGSTRKPSFTTEAKANEDLAC